MKQKSLLIIGILSFICLTVKAYKPSIIPYPNSIIAHSGIYYFEYYNLSFDEGLKNEAIYIKHMFQEDFNINNIHIKKEGNIRLILDSKFKNAEAYRLHINRKGI